MEKRAQSREPYERPRVVKVVVVREEMAVAGCKTTTLVRGPFPDSCRNSNCRAVGS